MTVIVYDGDSVFVDSYQTHGSTEGLVDKRHFVERVGTFACAGDVHNLMLIMADMEKAEKPLDYTYPLADADGGGCILWRSLADDSVYYMGMQRGNRWLKLPNLKSHPVLPFVAGAGQDFFLAYYAEHGDIERAIALAAEHHNCCALPILAF